MSIDESKSKTKLATRWNGSSRQFQFISGGVLDRCLLVDVKKMMLIHLEISDFHFDNTHTHKLCVG